MYFTPQEHTQNIYAHTLSFVRSLALFLSLNIHSTLHKFNNFKLDIMLELGSMDSAFASAGSSHDTPEQVCRYRVRVTRRFYRCSARKRCRRNASNVSEMGFISK